MNCEEIRGMYLAGESEDLTRAHMGECAACRAVQADLDAARLSLSEPVIWEEPSPELETQVAALIAGSRLPMTSAPRRQRWIRPVAAAAVFIAAGTLPAAIKKAVTGSTVSIKAITERDAAQWLADEAKTRHLRLDQDARTELIQTFGSDTSAMRRALDQLAVTGAPITAAPSIVGFAVAGCRTPLSRRDTCGGSALRHPV